jgi:hypothetical protein
MKINKYDNFNYENTRNIIIDVIENLKHDDVVYDGSFNSGFYKYSNDEVKKEINIIVNELKKYNINLFNFIKEHENEVFTDHNFIDNSAIYDAILYEYDKNKAVLAGYEIDQLELDEFFIKYSYDYYKYDIGKKYLLQTYKNLDEYFRYTAEVMVPSLLEYLQYYGEFDGEKASIVKKCGNGYTTFVNMKYMKEKRKEFSDLYSWKLPHRIKDDIMQIYVGNDSCKISKKEYDDIKNKFDMINNIKKFNL